jgi:voltage-gated potassium channel
MPSLDSLKRKAYDALITPENNRISVTNGLLMGLIVLSIIMAVLDTEPSLAVPYRQWFLGADVFFIGVFSIEYLVRVWVCTCEARYAHPVWGRLKYIGSRASLLDLLALVPLLIFFGYEPTYLLRMFRLFRIARLSRIGQIFHAYDIIADVIDKKKYELLASLMVSMAAMLIAATLLYAVEGQIQPEAFGSIPRALWWAVITLTTIGYGDTYPVTALGKVIACLSAIVGVAVIAAPTGILAAGFSEAGSKHYRPHPPAQKPEETQHPRHKE